MGTLVHLARGPRCLPRRDRAGERPCCDLDQRHRLDADVRRRCLGLPAHFAQSGTATAPRLAAARTGLRQLVDRPTALELQPARARRRHSVPEHRPDLLQRLCAVRDRSGAADAGGARARAVHVQASRQHRARHLLPRDDHRARHAGAGAAESRAGFLSRHRGRAHAARGRDVSHRAVCAVDLSLEHELDADAAARARDRHLCRCEPRLCAFAADQQLSRGRRDQRQLADHVWLARSRGATNRRG